MNRIPFTLPDVGLREVRGLVYLDEAFLVIKIQDALLGIVDEASKVIKIEPAALRGLWIRTGLFKDRLVIEPKHADLLDEVPGDHPNEVELRVPRKHRATLERLVDEFEALRYV